MNYDLEHSWFEFYVVSVKQRRPKQSSKTMQMMRCPKSMKHDGVVVRFLQVSFAYALFHAVHSNVEQPSKKDDRFEFKSSSVKNGKYLYWFLLANTGHLF